MISNRFMTIIFGIFFAASATAATPPSGARAYIVQPADGSTVSSPLTVIFGLEGFGVAPAGVDHPQTGHHHLIIDAQIPDTTKPIPASENYVHLGGGQTQYEIELTPGVHTLQLLLGDHAHVPHNPPVMSERITITVE